MDPMIETECFRVAQEALTNIVRHAQARRVALELQRSNGHLHLRVRDDGIGFSTSSHASGLGITGMKKWSEKIRGAFTLTSAPGKGTTVAITSPLIFTSGLLYRLRARLTAGLLQTSSD